MTDGRSFRATGYAIGGLGATLKERAVALAQREEEAMLDDLVSLLLFRLGDEWYAFPIDGVREIYNEYRVARIPRVPGHILGVINVRGEIVSVTDLGTLFRVPGRTPLTLADELPSAIMVERNEHVTAVVVDEIGDIVGIPALSVEPAVSTLDKAQAEFVSGTVYLDGRLVAILNLEKLVEPIGAGA